MRKQYEIAMNVRVSTVKEATVTLTEEEYEELTSATEAEKLELLDSFISDGDTTDCFEDTEIQEGGYHVRNINQ